MAARCRICGHPERNEIEKYVLLGEGYRWIAERFTLSLGSLHRHRKHVVVIAGAPELIRQRGAEGKTLNTIAAELGLPRQRFNELLKARRDWSLAWEQGSAQHEQYLADLLEDLARNKNKMNPVPIMFKLKTMFHWVEAQYDRTPPAQQPNVMIVLPGALNPDTYMAQVHSRRLPALKAMPKEVS
jgi:hypothetical protein